MPGQLFVIAAPSGTGKSTVIAAVRAKMTGLGYSVSHTTRAPRKSEQDGVAYHFVGEAAFRSMVEAGEFVEWAEVYGRLYGTSAAAIRGQLGRGLDVLLDLDSQGARNTRAQFPGTVLIYLLPPSPEVLAERLRARGTEAEAEIQTRLTQAAREIRECSWFDFLVINDDLAAAIAEVESIIRSERCRTARRLAMVAERFGC